MRIEAKVDFWKKKLLDLGKRNKLINFPANKINKRVSRSSIIIESPSADELWNLFSNADGNIKFPVVIKTEETNGDSDSEANGDSDIFPNGYKTNQIPHEACKTFRALMHKSKEFMDNKGLNALYLAFGFLNWKENGSEGQVLRSPILLIPVCISQDNVSSPFIISRIDSEIISNNTLLYKLKNDFNLPSSRRTLILRSNVMKMSSRKPTLSFKIFLAVLVLPVVICILNGLYEVMTFNKEEYVVSQLEKRYYGEFECVGRDDGNGKEVYYLKSSLRPDLKIIAEYHEGWDKTPQFPVLLSYHKLVNDNFFNMIIQETTEKNITEPINLNKISVDHATQSVMNLIDIIDDIKKEYIKPDVYVDSSFRVAFSFNGIIREAEIQPGMNREWTEHYIHSFCKKMMQEVS